MKYIWLLFIAISISSCYAQTSSNKLFDFDKKIIVGEISNSGTDQILIDEDKFLFELNKKLYNGEKVLDGLAIENGITDGIKQVKFKYLIATASQSNTSVVRYLTIEDKYITMDVKDNGEVFLIESFFVSCEGTNICKPRLFYTDKGLVWSCRESYQCVSPEKAEIDKCKLTTTVL